MTAQNVALKLLTEFRKPMSATEIARVALERKLLRSFAMKPVVSIAQTLEKNVRERRRNNPQLRFVYESNHRLLALTERADDPKFEQSEAELLSRVELRAYVHPRLLEQVQLAAQSRIAAGHDDTVALLLCGGLATEAAHIREGLLNQLGRLDGAIPCAK